MFIAVKLFIKLGQDRQYFHEEQSCIKSYINDVTRFLGKLTSPPLSHFVTMLWNPLPHQIRHHKLIRIGSLKWSLYSDEFHCI